MFPLLVMALCCSCKRRGGPIFDSGTTPRGGLALRRSLNKIKTQPVKAMQREVHLDRSADWGFNPKSEIKESKITWERKFSCC
jgi:hypothetical protein